MAPSKQVYFSKKESRGRARLGGRMVLIEGAGDFDGTIWKTADDEVGFARVVVFVG